MKKKQDARSESRNRSQKRGHGASKRTQTKPPRENYKDDDHLTDTGANSRDNDWRWYAQSPELIRDYASYPFGYPVGALTGLPWTSNAVQNYSVPGVMVLYFQPTIGYADGENSPINVAMRKFYTEVRKSNSGATNYEAPDMMMYLLAMDSVFMYVSMLKRLYGVLMQATPLNRYYSKALVQGMYCNYEDLVKHIPDLRGFINLLCAKANALCIPNTLSYMARHSWMCEGLYLDSNTGKAQTYFYMPTDFYTYGPVSASSPATNLKYAEFIPQRIVANIMENWPYLHTFDDIVEFGWSLLNPLIEDQATNIMSGDILKAYGPEGIVRLVGIPDEYIVLPSYSPEVSSQIENATVTGCKLQTPEVTQELGIGTGYIKCTPGYAVLATSSTYENATTVSDNGGVNAYATLIGSGRLLNMHHDGVTPEEVMVATRLMNIPSSIKASNNLILVQVTDTASSPAVVFECRTLGSEVVVACHMIYMSAGGNATMGNTCSLRFFSHYGFAPSIAMATAFDWAPIMYPINPSFSGTTNMTMTRAVPSNIVGDVDNYAILYAENLENMSAVALMSEFWVG